MLLVSVEKKISAEDSLYVLENLPKDEDAWSFFPDSGQLVKDLNRLYRQNGVYQQNDENRVLYYDVLIAYEFLTKTEASSNPEINKKLKSRIDTILSTQSKNMTNTAQSALLQLALPFYEKLLK